LLTIYTNQKMEALEREIEGNENVHAKLKRAHDGLSASVLPKKPRKKRSTSESSSGSIDPTNERQNKSPQSPQRDHNSKYDIASTFNMFINETLRRLVESQKISESRCDEIKISLAKHKLDSTDVLADLQKELYRVCKIEYEKIEESSDRLNGFGWSRTKISHHMKRELQNKIDTAIEVIQSFIS